MKNIFTLLIVVILYPVSTFSYFDFMNVPDTLYFGEVIVGNSAQKYIVIKNDSIRDLKIKNVRAYDDFGYYSYSFKSMNLSYNQSDSFLISVKPLQNIDTYLHLFFEIEFSENRAFKPVVVKTTANFANKYYEPTRNKWGKDLYKSISGLISNHKSYSYKEARKILWTGADRKDNIVECIYTGKTVKLEGDDPDFAYLDQNGWNTEHTWPRSYGADDEPQLSDMFHIYPTDKNSNNKRADYPYDYVTTNITYQEGGSKLGKNAGGQIVFEVRDAHKGNTARSMFYFLLRYGNLYNYFTSFEDVLRKWNDLDPIDARESARNDSIFKYQNNRNPFIDYPEFLERMPDLTNGGGDIPEKRDIVQIDSVYHFQGGIAIVSAPFGKFSEDNMLDCRVYFMNNGNTKESVRRIMVTSKSIRFSLNDNLTLEEINPYSYGQAALQFNYEGINEGYIEDSANVEVEFVSGKSFKTKVYVKSLVLNVDDNQNTGDVFCYPNPMQNVLNIDFGQFDLLNSRIELYNLMGSKVADLSGEFERMNNSMLTTFNLDNYHINSGPYVLKISNSKETITKLISIIK